MKIERTIIGGGLISKIEELRGAGNVEETYCDSYNCITNGDFAFDLYWI